MAFDSLPLPTQFVRRLTFKKEKMPANFVPKSIEKKKIQILFIC
nr:MAG TPA: hypothetical protein [Caudoviricetes sp.]